MKRNHRGYRVGEDHHNAKLSDAQVKDMRQLYASWKANGSAKGYAHLEEIFGVSKWTCRDIIKFYTRP